MLTPDLAVILTQKIIPLVCALIGFGSLIAVHELGHFLFCKLFGIHTPTFSIGFGPELFRRQIGDTNFRLALIPLGGYVEIAGLVEVGQGEQAHATITGERSFESKPYWQKFLVLMGGILFNLISAYIIFCTLFLVGTSDRQAIIIAGVVKASAAEKAGLMHGDAITDINGVPLVQDAKLLANAQDLLLTELRSHPNQDVVMTVLREDKILKISALLGSRHERENEVGTLGANLVTPMPKLPFLQALKAGFDYTNNSIILLMQSIKGLFTSRSLEGAGGPVMMLSMSFTSAQNGILPLLSFLGLMNINLMLLNMLPIGALDGGQLLFVTIEAIIRRKLPMGLRNGLNIASWIFFIGLAVLLTYRDVVHLFGSSIKALWSKLATLVG